MENEANEEADVKEPTPAVLPLRTKKKWVDFNTGDRSAAGAENLDASGMSEASEEDVERLNQSSQVAETLTDSLHGKEGAVIDARQVQITVEKHASPEPPVPSSPVKLQPPPKTPKKSETTPEKQAPIPPLRSSVTKTNALDLEVSSEVTAPSPSRTIAAEVPATKPNGRKDVLDGALQSVPLDNAVPKPAVTYENGQLLTTVRPTNQKWAWITAASFDAESVPPELLVPSLSITADDYTMTMDFLLNDYRFGCYNICYRRLIICWLLVGFVILLGVLFSGHRGITLFGIGICWLIVNAIGIVACLYIKARINRNLEIAVSSVNRILMRQKVLIAMEDQGRVSCHKICLHFVYYDCSNCLAWVNEQLAERERKEQRRVARDTMVASQAQLPAGSKNSTNTAGAGGASAADAVNVNVEDTEDIIVKGHNTNVTQLKRLERAESILLRYSQLYVKDLTRGLLELRVDVPEGFEAHQSRHCRSTYCLCQFVEQNYFRMRPKKWYTSFV